MSGAEANELSTQLWRQREILELLLFKCEEEQLLIASGKTRWLPYAVREVEKVVERLKDATLSLAVVLSEVAVAWGLDQDTQLEELATRAPSELWRELLGEHRTAITGLIHEVRGVRASSIRQAQAALTPTDRAARRGSSMYTATGHIDYTAAVAHLIDASL
jgi:hypothetical protein